MNTLNSQYTNPFKHDTASKKWTQEKIKEVIDTFQLYKTVKRVAIILNKSEDTIKKILNSNGISTPTRSQFSTQQWSSYELLQKIETQLKIIEIYSNGLSAKEIGKQYGVSASKIRDIIHQHNAQKNLPKHYLIFEANKDSIIKSHSNGMTFVELSKQYNCSTSAIREFIKKHSNYQLRKKSKNPIPVEDIEKIYDLHHNQNYTLKQIGELYGCSSPCVKDFFDKNNVPRRTKAESVRLKNYEEANLSKKLRSRGKGKMVTLPSGKVIKVMGYEDSFLKFVFDNDLLKEEEIEFNVKSIPYIQNGINRKYIPDFYIPKLNLIIEVKSRYILKLHTTHNLICKQDAVLKKGHGFCLILDNNFEPFLEILNT
jgi:Mor family transcriptional regulator